MEIKVWKNSRDEGLSNSSLMLSKFSMHFSGRSERKRGGAEVSITFSFSDPYFLLLDGEVTPLPWDVP